MPEVESGIFYFTISFFEMLVLIYNISQKNATIFITLPAVSSIKNAVDSFVHGVMVPKT